jgi:uncharacterized protein with PIN domain
MNSAFIRFYEELNDFLPKDKKKTTFSCTFQGNPSVKDLIESLGVPHVEVDLILVNSKSVDFNYKVKDEDDISVYPVFESLDITSATHLREKPLRVIKFILDEHLGKLAKYLRLCGFDTLISTGYTDNDIIKISVAEKRIILTRDRQLLKNKKVTHGYWIRSDNAREQVGEVFRRLDLKDMTEPFTRCIECNSLLAEVKKEEIEDRLLPGTKKYYNDFKKCTGCDRIYWEGSHYERMKDMIGQITNFNINDK